MQSDQCLSQEQAEPNRSPAIGRCFIAQPEAPETWRADRNLGVQSRDREGISCYWVLRAKTHIFLYIFFRPFLLFFDLFAWHKNSAQEKEKRRQKLAQMDPCAALSEEVGRRGPVSVLLTCMGYFVACPLTHLGCLQVCLHIFSFFTARELVTNGLVCKHWRLLSLDSWLWVRLSCQTSTSLENASL
jgi:hypothetical protein